MENTATGEINKLAGEGFDTTTTITTTITTTSDTATTGATTTYASKICFSSKNPKP